MSCRGAFALAAAAVLVGPGGAAAQRYVAFGDSITRGYGDDPGRGGYPARLEARLDAAGQSATVENKGKDGESTAEGLTRLNSVSGAAGDTLLLMEGTNDIARSISNETAISNLRSMVRKGLQRGFGKVYLATIIPRGAGAQESARKASFALADRIRQAAWELGVPQPDPSRAYLDVPDFRTVLIADDSVHPTPRGYDVLADDFANRILGRDEQAPAPSFISPAHEATGLASNALLEVVLFDSQSGVDLASAKLTVNGAAIATEVSGDPRRAVLRARPGNLVGRPLLGVDAIDLASPPNRRLEAVSQFTVKGGQFLKGDIDKSGRVDGADLVELALAFGTKSGEARYDVDADLDANRRVDGADLAILAANFGLSSS